MADEISIKHAKRLVRDYKTLYGETLIPEDDMSSALRRIRESAAVIYGRNFVQVNYDNVLEDDRFDTFQRALQEAGLSTAATVDTVLGEGQWHEYEVIYRVSMHYSRAQRTTQPKIFMEGNFTFVSETNPDDGSAVVPSPQDTDHMDTLLTSAATREWTLTSLKNGKGTWFGPDKEGMGIAGGGVAVPTGKRYPAYIEPVMESARFEWEGDTRKEWGYDSESKTTKGFERGSKARRIINLQKDGSYKGNTVYIKPK